MGVPRPSRQSGPVGGTVTVRATVSRAPALADPDTGEAPSGNRPEAGGGGTVRTGPTGGEPDRPRPADRHAAAGRFGAEVSFSVPIAAAGAVEGELRLTGSDPLAFDDRRPFTVRADPPLRVAVVFDRRSRDARALGEALAPSTAAGGPPPGRRHRRPHREPADRLDDRPRYDVVYLLNAKAPSAAGWRSPRPVRRGRGGRGVLLGHGRGRAGLQRPAPAADVAAGGGDSSPRWGSACRSA